MADEEISSKKEEPVKGEAVDGATPTAKESEGWVLHPYSEVRKWWLMLMVIVTFINVIMIPVSVSFFTLEITRSLTWIAVNVVMDVLFVLDIALNFRVGYETDDTQYVIMDLPLIRMHYIKTWFFVDLLAILPLDYCLLILDVAIGLDLSVSGISGLRMMRLIKLIRMLSLLRLLRLPRFMRYIREWEQACTDFYEKKQLQAEELQEQLQAERLRSRKSAQEEESHGGERERGLKAQAEDLQERLDEEKHRSAELLLKIQMSSKDLEEEKRDCLHLQKQMYRVLKELRKTSRTTTSQQRQHQDASGHQTSVSHNRSVASKAPPDHGGSPRTSGALNQSFLECPGCRAQYLSSQYRELLAHLDHCLDHGAP